MNADKHREAHFEGAEYAYVIVDGSWGKHAGACVLVDGAPAVSLRFAASCREQGIERVMNRVMEV